MVLWFVEVQGMKGWQEFGGSFDTENPLTNARQALALFSSLDVEDGIRLTAMPAPFKLETGVKGATRVGVKYYPTLAEANRKADRWAKSNSQGSYWAVVSEADTSDSGWKVVSAINMHKRDDYRCAPGDVDESGGVRDAH